MKLTTLSALAIAIASSSSFSVLANPTPKIDLFCNDNTNSACGKPFMRDLCHKAYSKFEDDVVYTGRQAFRTAKGPGGYECTARLVCDSGIIKDGQIVYDRISGYDIKVALEQVQKKNCACGQATIIQKNCYLTLQGGKQ